MTTLLSVHETIDPDDERREYLDRTFEVSKGLGALRVELAFDKVVDEFQLYAALFDQAGVFRGHVQCPGGPGPRILQFVAAPRGSSWGCIDGDILPGTWTVRVDLDRFVIAGSYELRVTGLTEAPQSPEHSPGGGIPATGAPADAPLAGWVRGELHSHSRHSDGATSVDRLVEASRDAKLEFLAVSDHFTSAHWADVERLAADERNPTLLHSIEVTTHFGHANVHGLHSWPGTYLDGDGHGFEELAADVHAQGGLVGVNHPFSGRQAWHRTDAPWADIDLLEVVNASQGANNDAAIGLWDRLLSAGHRIVAVAGTDVHDPDEDADRLGQLTTLLRQDQLPVGARSEEAVIAAIAQGRVCVSRGASIDLSARSGEAEAPMGGELTLAGPLEVRAEISTPFDGVLFLFRDGLLWNLHPVHAGDSAVTVIDRSGARGPYRAELHRGDESEQFWASCNRSHESLLSLSNPIWVR